MNTPAISSPMLSTEQQSQLLKTLEVRFKKNAHRHPGIVWADVEARLLASEAALRSLHQMEETGGEPDVVGQEAGQYLFFDCAAESPKGRRSLCYDQAAWLSRKEHKPQSSAEEMAEAMGIEILDEAQYTLLQQLGPVDLKTSSWLKTPEAMRKLGGALFGDCRFGRVFFYHNGAESYYGARAFRGCLRV